MSNQLAGSGTQEKAVASNFALSWALGLVLFFSLAFILPVDYGWLRQALGPSKGHRLDRADHQAKTQIERIQQDDMATSPSKLVNQRHPGGKVKKGMQTSYSHHAAPPVKDSLEAQYHRLLEQLRANMHNPSLQGNYKGCNEALVSVLPTPEARAELLSKLPTGPHAPSQEEDSDGIVPEDLDLTEETPEDAKMRSLMRQIKHLDKLAPPLQSK